MIRILLSIAALGVFVVACTKESEPAPARSGQEQAATAESDEETPMTKLQPVKIGNYDVQPLYEEELSDGHFNLRITGGEVAAVREWVGPEDASGVVVVKTIIENDYQHGHVEMPNPIPAGARLWIEIETPTGEKLKGSVPLQP